MTRDPLFNEYPDILADVERYRRARADLAAADYLARQGWPPFPGLPDPRTLEDGRRRRESGVLEIEAAIARLTSDGRLPGAAFDRAAIETMAGAFLPARREALGDPCAPKISDPEDYASESYALADNTVLAYYNQLQGDPYGP